MITFPTGKDLGIVMPIPRKYFLEIEGFGMRFTRSISSYAIGSLSELSAVDNASKLKMGNVGLVALDLPVGEIRGSFKKFVE